VSETGHLNDLLHDTFGEGVMALGRAYAKLPRFLSRRAVYTQMQSENHIQMIVASVEDYRVLYMRLAECLHTMRVLRSLPLGEGSRQKIAQEALHVYAPLAHKMGMGKIKGELQDLAFRVLEPEGFQVQTLSNSALTSVPRLLTLTLTLTLDRNYTSNRHDIIILPLDHRRPRATRRSPPTRPSMTRQKRCRR
jgi:GTP pyrophosphokinase